MKQKKYRITIIKSDRNQEIFYFTKMTERKPYTVQYLVAFIESSVTYKFHYEQLIFLEPVGY